MPEKLEGANSISIPLDTMFDPDTGVEDLAFTANTLASYYRQFHSPGMDAEVDNNADININAGMNVVIQPFGVFLNGRRVHKNTTTSLTFDIGDSLPRIDSIIIQLNTPLRIGNILIKKGEPNATPTPPVMEYDINGICELRLYDVLIPAEAAALIIGNIIDNRVNLGLTDNIKISLANMPIWRGTQSEFDAIPIKNEETIYLILGS